MPLSSSIPKFIFIYKDVYFMEDSILHRVFHRQHHNLNMEQWIKDSVPPLTDLLKRSQARRKLNAESDAASDVEKAGEVNDEEEEDDEDGEKEAKQPTKRKSYIRENYRESCW